MKKIILLFFTFFIITTVHSQEDSNYGKEVYRIIKDNGDNISKIGTFKMLRNKIKLSGSDTNMAIPDTIKILVRNGFIKNITVQMDNGEVFTNTVSISLIHYSDRLNDELSNIHPLKHKEFILLGDVLKYDSEMGKNYTPDNITVTLPFNRKVKKGKYNIIIDDANGLKKIETKEGSDLEFDNISIYSCNINLKDGITNLIDYRIYSDFLGLIETSTNGIVNFEAKVNIPINPNNISNSNFYAFKAINPQVRYSRFDKDDRVININDSLLPSFGAKNKMELVQKSFLSAGASVDLLSYNPKHSFLEFNIPFITNFYLAEIIPTDKEYITSASYGSGLELKINRSNSFGINFGYYVHRLTHLYNLQRKIEEIKPFNYYNLNAEVFFYGATTSDALFLRFNYTSVFGDSNNFFQFQIGYKSGLNFNK